MSLQRIDQAMTTGSVLANKGGISPADWNTVTTAGVYAIGATQATWDTWTNTPGVGTYSWGTLIVTVTGSGNVVMQSYYPHNSDKAAFYTRSKYNASDWNPWRSSITNHGSVPAILADTAANRPTAGANANFNGRIFIETDTKKIWRENGNTWDQIGGGGSAIASGSMSLTMGSATWTKNNGEANVTGQVYDGSASGSGRFMFHSGSGSLNVYVDGEVYVGEGSNRVYHPANKPSATDIGAYAYATTTVAGINDFTSAPGAYTVENAQISGLPGSYHYLLYLGKYSGGGYRTQLAMPFESGQPTALYIRRSEGTTWGSWVKLATNATDVGLGNVTNESKATMFTSPTFTGTMVAPTFTSGNGNEIWGTANGTFWINYRSYNGTTTAGATTSIGDGKGAAALNIAPDKTVTAYGAFMVNRFKLVDNTTENSLDFVFTG